VAGGGAWAMHTGASMTTGMGAGMDMGASRGGAGVGGALVSPNELSPNVLVNVRAPVFCPPPRTLSRTESRAGCTPAGPPNLTGRSSLGI
jgi:hypothetical protein